MIRFKGYKIYIGLLWINFFGYNEREILVWG